MLACGMARLNTQGACKGYTACGIGMTLQGIIYDSIANWLLGLFIPCTLAGHLHSALWRISRDNITASRFDNGH